MSEPFVAEIKIFAGNFAPRNYAFCDGQLMQVSQNTALFSLVGTTYGGDGRTTFGIPDLQGRAPMNAGNGPGLTSRRLGEKSGVESVILTESQMPSHSHILRVSAGQANSDHPENKFAAVAEGPAYAAPSNLTAMATGSLDPTGGNQSHDNMQPFLVLNFIIALFGLYPSRS